MKAGGTVCIICLVILLVNAPRVRAGESADKDTGNSAALHILAGASSTLLVSAVAYPLIDTGNNHRSALLVAGLGLGGALVAGATKELLDMSGWGKPQWTDLLLTLGGGLLAGSMVYAVSCLQPGGENGNTGIAVMYATFALTLSLPVGESLYRRFIPSSVSRS
ncbi:MAG: hypothetical protein JSV89_08330 [Spirochaetaceae bacterium]|nr:MAG: hypothetical protein JSV89_08330 [Spirochaetaceae bacterium]